MFLSKEDTTLLEEFACMHRRVKMHTDERFVRVLTPCGSGMVLPLSKKEEVVNSTVSIMVRYAAVRKGRWVEWEVIPCTKGLQPFYGKRGAVTPTFPKDFYQLEVLFPYPY